MLGLDLCQLVSLFVCTASNFDTQGCALSLVLLQLQLLMPMLGKPPPRKPSTIPLPFLCGGGKIPSRGHETNGGYLHELPIEILRKDTGRQERNGLYPIPCRQGQRAYRQERVTAAMSFHLGIHCRRVGDASHDDTARSTVREIHALAHLRGTRRYTGQQQTKRLHDERTSERLDECDCGTILQEELSKRAGKRDRHYMFVAEIQVHTECRQAGV